MNARKRAIKALEAAGYRLVRNGSDHDIYKHSVNGDNIPLKRHKMDEDDLRYILQEIRRKNK